MQKLEHRCVQEDGDLGEFAQAERVLSVRFGIGGGFADTENARV
ncbi:hypothetical protein ACIGEP_05565 [Microbacterium sp. NPDC077663]